MAEEIDIISICPICKKQFTCTIDKASILNASNFPVPFKVDHCGSKFIILIDADFKCVERRLLTNIKKEGTQIHSFDPKLSSKLSPDDLIVYEYNSENSFLIDRIPDLTEKHLIRVISRNKVVNLGRLIRECAVVGKALNRNISREKLLDILDKYVEKEIIMKQEISVEEEETSSLFRTNIPQGGNI